MSTPIWVKPGLIGAAAGAILVAGLGFYAGGWMTGTKAEKMASARASEATITAQVPFCIQTAHADPAQAQVLEKLASAQRYQRNTIVMEAGWADVPGQNRPSSNLASECAEMLLAQK